MSRSGSSSGFHFLQDYCKCQKHFYWKYVMRLRERFSPTATLYGRAIHAAMEGWYTALKEREPVYVRVHRAIEAFTADMQDGKSEYANIEYWNEDQLRGAESIRRYGLQYSSEMWEVISTEEPLECTLPSGATFTGRSDLTIRWNGKVYLVDHKTTGWSLESLAKSLAMSDQATGYTMLWNEKHPEMPITGGVIFNIIRNYKNSIDYKQPIVVRSAQDVARFKLEADDVLSEITNKIACKGIWRKNTESCFMYNRPCPYSDLCMGSNFEALIGTKYFQSEAIEESAE